MLNNGAPLLIVAMIIADSCFVFILVLCGIPQTDESPSICLLAHFQCWIYAADASAGTCPGSGVGGAGGINRIFVRCWFNQCAWFEFHIFFRRRSCQAGELSGTSPCLCCCLCCCLCGYLGSGVMYLATSSCLLCWYHLIIFGIQSSSHSATAAPISTKTTNPRSDMFIPDCIDS